MLSLEEAAPYLLARQLIDPAWVIDGSLSIQCAAPRNGNLKIEGPAGAGLFIKEPDDPAERGRETLSAEAAFYQFCQNEPAAAPIAELAPRLVYHDARRCLIALRLLSEAVTLSSFLTGKEERRSLIDVSGALGRALGTIHRTSRQAGITDDPRLAWLSPEPPWVMTIHRPTPQVLASLSPANAQLIRMLQAREGCAEHLDRLREHWLAETVIHGDIRPDNVLVRKSRGDAPSKVRIIDWEMVSFGDPAWDLSGALQGFASTWVESMPMTPNLSIDERVALASFPLDLLQGLCQSLWYGYQAASEPCEKRASELVLDRAEKLLQQFEMIQSAYEISKDLIVLDPRSVIMAQLGANVLAQPELAATQLFGIPRRAALQ